MNSSPLFPKIRCVGFVGWPLANAELPDAVRTGIQACVTRVAACAQGVQWVACSTSGGLAEQAFASATTSIGIACQVLSSGPGGIAGEGWVDAALEIVERADVVAIISDGKAPSAATVVRYARELGRPLLIVDPVSGTVREEQLDRVTANDVLIDDVNALPAVNSVASAEAGSIDRPAVLVDFWQKADSAATTGAPKLRRLVVAALGLHALAIVLAAAVPLAGDGRVVVCGAGLVVVLAAAGAMAALRRHHGRQDWMRRRIVAEVCRSALGSWGVPGGLGFLNRIRVPELQGVVRSIGELQRQYPRAPGKSLAAFKEGYLIARIERQASYFRRQELRCGPSLRRLRTGFWVATAGAAAAFIVAGVGAVAPPEPAHTGDLLASGMWPLLAAGLGVAATACLALIFINDLQRRLARLRDMQALLARSRKQLMAAETWGAVARLIGITEEGLLHEVLEWHAVAGLTESH